MADPYELIVANQFNLPAIDAAAQQARRGRLAEMMLGKQMEQEAAQQQQLARVRAQATQQYQSGDTKGAKETAALGGDDELFRSLSNLDAEQAKALNERAQLIGEAARWADTPEKWDGAIDWLAANGHPDLAEWKGKFSPENRMAAISAAGKMKEHLEGQKPLVGRPGDWIMDPTDPTKVLQKVPFKPEYMAVDPDKNLYEFSGQGGFGEFYQNFLAPTEGGYVANDGGSGAPANFGVNQKFNPDIDVANLTQQEAAQILHDRYWVPSGADEIQDPRLQAIHADTAINAGVERAKTMLSQSGADPERYLALREAYYRSLGGPNLKGWLKRNKDLAAYTGIKKIQSAQPKAGDDGTPDGLLSKGYRIKPDGTMEYVPGGPADPGSVELPPAKEMAKRNAAYPKVSQSYRGSTAKIDSQLKDLETLMATDDWRSIVGLLDSRTPNIRGPARRAQALYDRIMARAQFNELQEMRNNSPTGGALGQVSEWEGQKLRDAAAALQQTQDEEDFKARVEDYIFDLKTSRENLATAFEDTYAYRNQTTAPAASGTSNDDALIEKYLR